MSRGVEARKPQPAEAASPSIPALMAEAVALHRAGKASAAHYRQILQMNPAQADALHLFGVIALQAAETRRASLWLNRAVTVDDRQAIFQNSLGEAERIAGRDDEAHRRFRRAAILDPAYGDAYANLLKVADTHGTRVAFARFCRIRRPDGAALLTIADALLQCGRLDAARTVFRATIEREPQLVSAYVNLGATESKAKSHEGAAAAYRRAIFLQHDHAGAWNNMASAAWELHKGEDASTYCRQSIALKPDHPDAYANLGYVLRCQAQNVEDFASAERLCQRALTLVRRHASGRNNLGIVNLDMGRLPEAEAAFRQVLAADPNNPDARFNLALVLLRAGRLEEAWPYYEARFETGQVPTLAIEAKLWKGEPLRGRRIILYYEQGQGDTLHFARYAPLVAARGGNVSLLVQPALKRLLSTMPGVSVYTTGEAIPAAELKCPLLSLPGIFQTALENVPAPLCYVYPPADCVEQWLRRPLPGGGLRVGLVWSGDPRPGLLRAHLTDRRRSMTLDDMAPLATVAGVRFINLQMGSAAAQLAAPPSGLEIFDPMAAVTDFADTAALILRLDLVVTVDTSVAHLAGALGKPVWVMSRVDGCWRWLHERDESPWYPTMRLYRQARPGDWHGVVRRVAADLARIASDHA